MHRIRSETLGKTLAETLWCEKSRQESRLESRQESCRDPLRDSWWDSCRDFSHERVLPRVFPRVSDRILCMTLSETLSETLFFTREGTLSSKKIMYPWLFSLWRFLRLVTDKISEEFFFESWPKDKKDFKQAWNHPDPSIFYFSRALKT